ncbi:MAG: TonB-dependent receptor [Pseudomonadota bacterium]
MGPKGKPTAMAVAVAAAGAVYSGQVIAQDESAVLEEVIVTASRRSESVQDIPYNITAVTGDFLLNQGADDLRKLSQFVPGLQLIDVGARDVGQATLRGMNIGELTAAETQQGESIARYINDTPLQIDYKLFDIDRVEVLRGPQGTLYGRGALGGTIRYILNNPTTDGIEGRLNGRVYQMEESDGTSYRMSGVLNLPLNDTLALRVSGSYLDEDGFVDYTEVLLEPGVSNDSRVVDDVNTEETTSIRAALRWEPTDDFYGQINVLFQEQKAGGRQATNEDFTGDEFELPMRYLEPRDAEDTMVNLELGWKSRYVELFSSTSYTDFDAEGTRDGTDILCEAINPYYCEFPEFSAFTVDEDETEIFVQEFRLLSTDAGPERVDWIVGAFYEEEQDKNLFQEFTPGFTDFIGIDTGFGDLEFEFKDDTTYTELAIFGELTVHITDAWQVTGGARYFDQETDIEFACTSVIFAGVIEDCISGKGSIDDTVFKFNTSYNFTDDIMLYATFSEGFRRGGVNAGPFLQSDEQTFDSDAVENYELGWHTTLADGRLIFNGAIFRIYWDDLQVPGRSEVAGVTIIQNANEGVIDGVELSAQAALGDNLTFNGWITYYDTGLDGDAPEIGGMDGDAFPGVPELQANVGLDYVLPLSGGDVIFRGNAYYKDEVATQLNSGLPDYLVLDDYWLVNASVEYAWDNWRTVLYAENLLDEYYFTGGRGGFLYGEQGQFNYTGRPRLLGLEVNYDF